MRNVTSVSGPSVCGSLSEDATGLRSHLHDLPIASGQYTLGARMSALHGERYIGGAHTWGAVGGSLSANSNAQKARMH